jgi:uncharacterized membrane protein YeaQ/YmgE (transglycosylase-associated protein family)
VIIARVAGRTTRTIVRDVAIHIPIVRVCIISKIGVSIGAKVAMSMKVHTAKIATNTLVESVKGAVKVVVVGLT